MLRRVTLLIPLLAACGPGPTEPPKPVVLPPMLRPAEANKADPGGGPTAASAKGANGDPARASKVARMSPPPTFTDEKVDVGDLEPTGTTGPDPMNGSFTMAQATAGLGGSGPVVATIKTSKGDLRCKLYEEKAPLASANFVGLARGTRPWKKGTTWISKPAYDGTTFHRIIKGFMIQGGDPQGTGRGEPGYVFKDELWPGARHDRAGLLCMANRGPDTNGMQFFITDAGAAHLDKSYTIFGDCSPVSTVHAIANVPVFNEKPEQPVVIEKVEITRASGGSGPTAPAGPAGSSAPTGSGPSAPAPPGGAAAPPPTPIVR